MSLVSLVILAASSAQAGPPYQACAVDEAGNVAFVSPRDGRVFSLSGDSSTHIATVPLPDQRHHHVILAHPQGGWMVGTGPVHWVKKDGSVVIEDHPEPDEVYRALADRQAATGRGAMRVTVTQDDKGGTVFRTEGAEQSRLWSFDHWSKGPLGFFVHGSTVYAVSHAGVEIHPATGAVTVLEAPSADTVGVCATGKATYAVSKTGRAPDTCVHKLAGTTWNPLFCL